MVLAEDRPEALPRSEPEPLLRQNMCRSHSSSSSEVGKNETDRDKFTAILLPDLNLLIFLLLFFPARKCHADVREAFLLATGTVGNKSQVERLSPSPELKSWVDNCLVPILVKEFLKQSKADLASEAQVMA